MNPTRALVIRWEHAACVIRADDVLAIDEDGEAARISLPREPLPLARSVPGAVDDPRAYPWLRLIVRCRAGRVGFRAAAAVEIREGVVFHALPRLLNAAGSPPGVRGMALVPDDEQPLPWIDLGELGDSHHSNQAHLACAEG